MSAQVRIDGILQTLPDPKDATGEYATRGIRTRLYRFGCGYVLHTIDRDDPAVERTAKMIGSRDAALWLADRGCHVPQELWGELQGRYNFDADGKPIIPTKIKRTRKRRRQADAKIEPLTSTVSSQLVY